MRAVLLTPRGEKQEAIPKDGVAFTVTELQDMVQGYVEIEDIEDELIIVYDVNGNYNNKLFNPKATEILKKAHADEPFYSGYVSGNALVCGNDMVRN